MTELPNPIEGHADLPRLEDANDADLRLALGALPRELLTYGGFIRAALAGIYAERSRRES